MIGSCRFFRASNAADYAALNPSTAGWKQIAGRFDRGQSSSTVAILDNGLVRLVLDKDANVLLLVFANGAWRKAILSESDWKSPRVVEIRKNSRHEIRVLVEVRDRNGGAGRFEVRLTASSPVTEWKVEDKGNLIDENFFIYPASTWAATFTVDQGVIAPAIVAGGATPTLTSDCWIVAYPPDDPNHLAIFSTTETNGFRTYASNGMRVGIRLGQHEVGDSFFMGGIPAPVTRYGSAAFSGGGFFRPAFDARAFEGDVPFVGPELLTNGGFETNVSGWSIYTGAPSIARVTTDSKFGSASAQVTRDPTAGANFDYTFFNRLTIVPGTKYAISGWVKKGTATSVGLGADFRDSSFVVTGSLPNQDKSGSGWQYVSLVGTAPAGSAVVDVYLRVIGAGAVTGLFDGFSVVALPSSFDGESTSGWTVSAGSLAVVDGVWGSAIQQSGGSGSRNLEAAFSPQDWTGSKYLMTWIKGAVAGTDLYLYVKNAGTYSSAISILGAGAGAIPAGAWVLVAWDISGITRSNVTGIKFIPDANALAFDHFTLSDQYHDRRPGTYYGVWDRCEAVGDWAATGGTLTLTTTAGEFVESAGFKYVTTAAGQIAGRTFPAQDWRSFSYLALWVKSAASSSFKIRYTDASGATTETSSIATTTAFQYITINGGYHSDSSIDWSRVTRVDFVAMAGDTFFFDFLKLTDSEHSGEWRPGAASADNFARRFVSNGLGLTTPSSTNELRFRIHVPHTGEYRLGIRARKASGSVEINVPSQGTFSPVTVSPPSTAWASDPAWTTTTNPQNLVAGVHTLAIRNLDAVAVEIDAILLIPVRESSSSGTTVPMPREIAHDALFRVEVAA